ncbi:MAG: precorrin-6A reductase [Desulfitobacteriaceae bacterium]
MKFLILAGTLDGRLLAKEFAKRGHEILVSTLTAYGADLVEERGLNVRYGAFEAGELAGVLREGVFTALIDATHPYATGIRETAQEACFRSSIPYFRWQRPSTVGSFVPFVYWAEDIPQASELAAGFGERILLTTGSNSLPEWLKQAFGQGKTVYVRVLPTSKILKHCEELGLKPYQIIAAQGPFSQAWNEAVILQLGITVMIAKDSGKEGGTPEKIRACQHLGIPLILLRRPDREQPELSRTQFIEKLEEEMWKRR